MEPASKGASWRVDSWLLDDERLIAPNSRIMSLGRNDPCPCGSGKKHKRCCLAALASMAPAYTEGDRDEALARLQAFIATDRFKSAMPRVFEGFFGPSYALRPPDERTRIVDHPTCNTGLFTFMLYDDDIEGGKSVAEIFLERTRRDLSGGVRRYIERMCASSVGLYEILAVELDQGLELRDMHTGRRIWVRERLGTHGVHRFDVMLLRLRWDTEEVAVLDGAVAAFTPLQARPLMRLLAQRWEAARATDPEMDLASFLKRRGPPIINQFFIDQVLCPQPPKLVTADGDPLMFCDVIFDLRNEERLRAALSADDHVEVEDEQTWTLFASPFSASSDQVLVLATIRIQNGRLICETKSRERAERMRDRMSMLAGDALRFREIQTTSVEEARAERGSGSSAKSTGRGTLHADPLLEAFFARFYGEWLDTPIPMLADQTPRQAVHDEALRSKLVVLLKELQRDNELKREAGTTSHDVSWMWNELGLSPDEPCALAMLAFDDDDGESSGRSLVCESYKGGVLSGIP